MMWCDNNESDANTPAHYANVYFNHFIGGKASHDTSDASFSLLAALSRLTIVWRKNFEVLYLSFTLTWERKGIFVATAMIM